MSVSSQLQKQESETFPLSTVRGCVDIESDVLFEVLREDVYRKRGIPLRANGVCHFEELVIDDNGLMRVVYSERNAPVPIIIVNYKGTMHFPRFRHFNFIQGYDVVTRNTLIDVDNGRGKHYQFTLLYSDLVNI